MAYLDCSECGYEWDSSVVDGDHSCITDLQAVVDPQYVIKDSGIKHDQGKPRMDLLPMDALVEVAKVLTFGAAKYGDHNWEKGIEVNRLRAAQLRHDAAVEMGEMIDPESGLLHTAHKTCDALMELAMRLRNEKQK